MATEPRDCCGRQWESLGKVYLKHGESSVLMNHSDLCETFPGGEYATALKSDWIMSLIRETRQNRDYTSRTHETARWAKELVKRQPITFPATPGGA